MFRAETRERRVQNMFSSGLSLRLVARIDLQVGGAWIENPPYELDGSRAGLKPAPTNCRLRGRFGFPAFIIRACFEVRDSDFGFAATRGRAGREQAVERNEKKRCSPAALGWDLDHPRGRGCYMSIGLLSRFFRFFRLWLIGFGHRRRLGGFVLLWR